MSRAIPALTILLVLIVFSGGRAVGQTFMGSVTQDLFCDLVPSPCCNNCANAPSMTLTIPGADTTALGDATLTLSFLGDLDDPNDENLTVSVEGFAMGTITNGNAGDDLFDHPTDVVTDCVPVTMSAIIPLADLQAIVADGQIATTFTPEQANNDIEAAGCPDPRETMTVAIEYPNGGVPTMPAVVLALLLCILTAVGIHFTKPREAS